MKRVKKKKQMKLKILRPKKNQVKYKRENLDQNLIRRNNDILLIN